MAFTDRLANRGSISTGFEIANSVMLDADNPDEMHFTTSSSSSDQQKGTFSFWVKPGTIVSNWSPIQINDYAAPYHAGAYFHANGLYWNHKDNSSQWTKWWRLFRDHAAWYHIVVVVDTVQAAGDDRHRMYVNGGAAEDIKDTDGHNSPVNQNDDYFWFANGRKMTVGGISTGDAYIADYHYIDGQVKAASDFGESDEDSGIWKPKKYTGTYGNNGFHLEFKQSGTSANASGIGADTSGNGHHMTLINIDTTNQTTDTPSNNFCTWNPINVGTSSVDTWDLSMGNTELTRDANGWSHYFGTIPLSSGKWYWEAEYQVMDYSVMGWHDIDAIIVGEPTTGMGGFVNYNGGEMRVDNSETSNNYGTVVNNSIIAVALNMDDGQVTIYRNNTAIVTNYSIGNSAGKTVVPFVRLHAASAASCSTNFGSALSFGMPASPSTDENGYGTFYYAPPSGYYAICTKNLAEFG